MRYANQLKPHSHVYRSKKRFYSQGFTPNSMTMQGKEDYKFKELHCDNCDKYMGYINAKHQSFPHDFFCTLKCLEVWKTKNKITDIKIERLKDNK